MAWLQAKLALIPPDLKNENLTDPIATLEFLLFQIELEHGLQAAFYYVQSQESVYQHHDLADRYRVLYAEQFVRALHDHDSS